MGFRAGLDWYGKTRPTGIRTPDHPARRQSLYRLRYPTHHMKVKHDLSFARVLFTQTLILAAQIYC